MARDRIDDDFDDDRPARRGRGDPDDRPRDRPSTTVPGVLLILAGGLSVLLSLLMLASGLGDPKGQVASVREARKEAEKKPPGQERDDELRMYDWTEKNIVSIEIGIGAVSLLTSALIVLAGFNVIRQGGYGLAMFGSILALIPCTNCGVCVAMPFGLFALITLMNADVKAAFRTRRRPGRPLED